VFEDAFIAIWPERLDDEPRRLDSLNWVRALGFGQDRVWARPADDGT